ncbi:hypothetical protein QFZ21_002986 [Microbacterium sp. W4I20]|nr:hypothetical protein [Microbacterium sp. W4I20]
MELVQQHDLPEPVEFVLGVRGSRAHGIRRRPQLGLDERVLGPAVQRLGGVLAGQGSAVQFEVELADPDGGVRQLGLGGVEEDVRMLPHDLRAALEVREALRLACHLAGRAAAPVTPAHGCDRPGAEPVLLELTRGLRDLHAAQLRVVGVHRREVREHLRAVDALPLEGVVREHVLLVPRDLLREEPLETGTAHQLRQSRGIAEAVGQPDALRADAELALEEPLAVRELAHQRFAGRHHGVGLDPHATQRQEASFGDRSLDALVDLGTVLLEPDVLLRAGHAVLELGLLLEQGRHRRGGAGDLADRLAHRPQPGGVDVCVTDGRDAVRTGLGGGCEHVGEAGAGIRGGRGDALQVEGVEGVVHRLQDAHAARRGRCELGLQLEQHLEIERELEHILLEHGEVHPPRAVERLARGGLDVTLLRRQEGVVVEQHGVGCGLEVQLDGLVAVGGLGDRQPLVARVDALHRAAVRAVHECLALEAGHVDVEPEVDDGFDAAAGPLGGDGSGEPEPGGPPGGTPRLSDGAGREVEGEAFRGTDRLSGQLVEFDGQRHGCRVDRRADALLEDPLDAADGERGVVMHVGESPARR